MQPKTLPRVLFVDDEQNLLFGINRQVRSVVAVETVTSPMVAARMLSDAVAAGDEFEVVVSDMRMPGIDGATLLKHASMVSPDTTRVLLTGYADMDSAMAAVNDGNIFRFLTKPCTAQQLRTVLAAAVGQYRLVRDRRELLERTLRGAVSALVETLAMAHPEAFARASRLGHLVREVCKKIDLPDMWQVEIAAQLGDIGAITLPPQALEVLTHGAPLTDDVAPMLDALPDLADGVLGRIPRLDSVRAIVRAQQPVDQPDRQALASADLPTRLLQVIREYDALTARGMRPADAAGIVGQRDYHPQQVVEALRLVVAAEEAAEIREVKLEELTPGMVLATDLRSGNGRLLVRHGHELTEEMLARINNFAKLYGLGNAPQVRW